MEQWVRVEDKFENPFVNKNNMIQQWKKETIKSYFKKVRVWENSRDGNKDGSTEGQNSWCMGWIGVG